MEALYHHLRQDYLNDVLDAIKSGAFSHLRQQSRLDIALTILERFRVVSVFMEPVFNSISFEVIPVSSYWNASLIKNRVDRQSAFGKPIIVTVSECWDDDEDCNVGLIGQNTCVAYIGTDGRTGLTFCNTDHDIDAQPWRRYLPLTDQASVISAMDSGHNAPNHALPSEENIVANLRRQQMYLDDVALSLGIPMDDPELFFYLLPNTFKFYASRAAK